VSKSSIARMMAAASNAALTDDGSAAIRAIVNPPKGCPACYAERGEHLPPTHSTAICRAHYEAMRLMSEARKTGAPLHPPQGALVHG
jgi:hypothetical protein